MVDQKKMKGQGNVIMIVLLIATLVLATVSRFTADKQVADLLKWMSIGLILAMFLFRIFFGKFGNKPTREELEERTFSNNN